MHSPSSIPLRSRRGALLAAIFLFAGAPAVVAQVGCGDDAKSTTTASASTSAASGAGGAPETTKIQILAFNDFHGNLEPPSGSSANVTAYASEQFGDAGTANDGGVTQTVIAGGAAYLATHLKQLRALNPNTAVVSAGDLTGASPLTSALFHDEPTVLAMNAIGLDFNAVGNHEFDHGVDELLRLQNGGCGSDGCTPGVPMFPGASYKYLAANVEEAANTTIFPPYAIKEIGGEKIAFIGMTLQATPTVTSLANVEGLTFEGEAATVAGLIPELRSQGVGPIVVLVHQGSFQSSGSTYNECSHVNGAIFDMAYQMDPGVDVIVSAHTHAAYNCQSIDGKLVTSAASFGRVITRIELTVDKSTHHVVDKIAENIVVTRDVDPDPAVQAIVDQYKTLAAPLADKVVGHVTGDLTAAGNAAGESILGDVIADAQLTATTGGTSDAVIAFMNPGGIRADIDYAPTGSELPGEVTYAETFTSQPFSNPLETMTYTGAQIKEILEEQFHDDGSRTILQISSSFTYSYDSTKASGMRVDAASMKLNGAPMDPSATYRVTMNGFLATGGDNFPGFTMGTEPVGAPGLDLDALVDYLSAVDPLTPPALDRIGGS